MIRLGIVSVKPHGEPWAEVLRSKFPEVELAAVWDYEREVAETFAKAYGIKKVVNHHEDMVDDVDAALIPGGRRPPEEVRDAAESYVMEWTKVGRSDHLRLSAPFLSAGKPVNVDKPFADSVEEAEEMISLARKNKAPLMSTSALRYSPQVMGLREVVEAGAGGIGDPRTLLVIMGGAPLVWYGVHGVEAMYAVFGPGVECVSCDAAYRYHGVKEPDAWLGIMKWKDQKLAMLHLLREAPSDAQRPLWPTTYALPKFLGVYYQMRLFGTTGVTDVDVKGKTYYTRMLANFMEMIQTREEPIPLEETLEVTKVLLALQRSVDSGERVYLKDL